MKDFHHPFRPYDIQLEFMNALYECIEDGQVGIFESPTGTFPRVSYVNSKLKEHIGTVCLCLFLTSALTKCRHKRFQKTSSTLSLKLQLFPSLKYGINWMDSRANRLV